MFSNVSQNCCQRDRLCCCIWNYMLFFFDEDQTQQVGQFQALFLWKLHLNAFQIHVGRTRTQLADCLSQLVGNMHFFFGMFKWLSEFCLSMLSGAESGRNLPLERKVTKRIKSRWPGPQFHAWPLLVLWGLPLLTGELGMLHQPPKQPRFWLTASDISPLKLICDSTASTQCVQRPNTPTEPELVFCQTCLEG